ncbi:hypothetical protein GCM10027515_32840 [Schumannella luteola]|uniref:Uncharacterized protein n=1 Tax=Schumannella luteola TaxID=472059 RepID=A0A852Y7I0_9MICO|nr:hypothetical protein [Schumannella luteola]NYG98916.1 hypothetical protein [Schumannella luteola]TPX06294.1 hypothetical protein FJ656_01225 [Schumannella luteola]
MTGEPARDSAEAERGHVRVVARIALIIGVIAFALGAVTVIDTIYQVQAQPDCEVYCGGLGLIPGTFVLMSWMFAAALSLPAGIYALTVRGARRAGVLALALAAVPVLVSVAAAVAASH